MTSVDVIVLVFGAAVATVLALVIFLVAYEWWKDR